MPDPTRKTRIVWDRNKVTLTYTAIVVTLTFFLVLFR